MSGPAHGHHHIDDDDEGTARMRSVKQNTHQGTADNTNPRRLEEQRNASTQHEIKPTNKNETKRNETNLCSACAGRASRAERTDDMIGRGG